MKNYRVTLYFSEIFYVEAESEAQAEEIAMMRDKNNNAVRIPDDVEVEGLDEEEGDC